MKKKTDAQLFKELRIESIEKLVEIIRFIVI